MLIDNIFLASYIAKGSMFYIHNNRYYEREVYKDAYGLCFKDKKSNKNVWRKISC